MPYSSYAALAMGLPEAADTDRVDISSIDQRLISTGALDLRRAQSESDVATVGLAPPPAPTASASASSSSPGSILVHPPTPTRPDDIDTARPMTPPPPLPRTPARPLPQSSSPAQSPRSSSASAIPTVSSLGITVTGNVLPEVRSPRRNQEQLAQLPPSRRSRRPRLFGFTAVESPTGSLSSSPVTTPPASSPASSTTPHMLPRRNPVRVKSETSLHTLGHAEPPASRHPPRPRRDTGLKLDLKGIIPQAESQAPMTDGSVGSRYHTVIKKKSGEVVRPALKYSGDLLPNGTPADKSRPYFESRSCPTTPSCPKYVHFDSKLEHVKLFLQDQKPKVVSHQGSPTDAMSEEEDEPEPQPVETVLQIKLPNMPTSHPPDSDMHLESLFLNDSLDALRGVVVVRNLSFQKWVAVRFTFDWWQTTSEVTATYKDSVRGGTFDRFTFTLKLTDLLDRIEDKTLFLCLRYNTDGREIWDANGGANYQVLFERKAKEQAQYMPKRTRKIASGMGKSVGKGTWSVTGSDADRMADLRARLNRLTAEDRELTAPLPVAPRGRVGFSSPRTASPAKKESKTLSSRYDFGSALKSSRHLSPTMRGGDLPSPSHAATEFYSPRAAALSLHGMGPNSPLAGPPSPNPVSPASPVSPVPFAGSASPLANSLTTLPALGSANSSSTSSLSSVTSMQTPADSPAIRVQDVADSTDSSVTTDSPSPLSPPSDSPVSPAEVLPWINKDRESPDMSRQSYSSFIEQFCWGGGGAPDEPNYFGLGSTAPASAIPTGTNVRRVHSATSLDQFATPPDLTPRAFTPPHGLSRSTSAQGSTPRSRASPPTLEDLEHVDSAIRSLSSSLASTPVDSRSPASRSPSLTPSRSPSLTPSMTPPAISRIPSGSTVLAS